MHPGPGASAVIKVARLAFGAVPGRRFGDPYPSGRTGMFARGFRPGRAAVAVSAW
jgi:hypothetical protein